VLGDVAAGLGQLAEMVSGRDYPGPRPGKPSPEPAMTAPFVLSRQAALRPADAMLVEEAPTARGAMHDHLPVTCEKGFFTCASGGLGYGLPAAIGVARASGGRKVIALLGDGSAMYTIQGLWSAAEQGSNVSFVILNNGRYAALEQFSQMFAMSHLPGTAIGGIDFVALAQGMGLGARRVQDAADLDAALAWSLGASGPTLVELIVA